MAEVRQIILRSGTSAEWEASGAVLALGELGFDSTVGRVKTGNGSDSFAGLPWSTMSGAEVQRVLDAAEIIESAGTATDAAMAVELAKPDSASRAVLSDAFVEALEEDAASPAGVIPISVASYGDGRYAAFSKMKAGSLAAAFGTVREPFPPVTADAPAIVHAAATGMSGAFEIVSAQDARITKLGHPGEWNSTFGQLRVSGPGHAVGFIVGSATFEIRWYNNAPDNVLWLWVDGHPMTVSPETPAGLSAATLYTKLTFPTAKVRRIEFWAQNNDSWLDVRVPIGAYVAPLPKAPNIAFVGDSFLAGSDTTFCPTQKTAAYVMARSLGARAYNASIGGTGYATPTAATRFGSADRVALVAKTPDLDLIVMEGSVNDDPYAANVQAAAEATYAAYAAACPGVPIIVFGPQPSNATDTISANRRNNVNAVKAAAASAPNVIAFIDMVGTAGPAIPAWSSATTYSTGSLVTYRGSVWEAANGTGTVSGSGETPGSSIRWKLRTLLYTGTGKVGATVGDGTRDTVLYSDSVHPTETGSYLMGLRQAGDIIRALQLYASGA
ncbi:GDSL-type esterase/lipase family protein [Microbacterium plantarum]|uniref:GDSL-type esterase/lipase family protein n=1 Tax=Microbacterium plantarum TaxID=1816425 RepID=UPI002B4A62D4|nr:GDSL-type esterase/lipase family protein [Microbacterium plantarum]WRK16105.1 GDSL-type esterase/lipase family protein [Microbacterium plantarum]